MERIVLKRISNIPGFPHEITNMKLGKNSIILAPNAFGKTSIVNAITSRYYDNQYLNDVIISIEENGVIYNDLNVIKFSGETLINSLSLGEEQISVGYEILTKNALKNDINDLTERFAEIRNVIQTMFGYSNAQVISKITGIRGTNVVNIGKSLLSDHYNKGIELNQKVYDDLKKLYLDYSNGLNEVFNHLDGIMNTEDSNVCNIIDFDLKKSIKKYLKQMNSHHCELPNVCPLCNSLISDWNNIITSYNSLSLSTFTAENQTEKYLSDLINADFESNIFKDLRNQILEYIVNNRELNVRNLINIIKQQVTDQINYQLELGGFKENMVELYRKENELNSLNQINVSINQLNQIKTKIEDELVIFDKNHIRIDIDDSSLRFTMIEADITESLSESERNLISLLYFRQFIDFNTQNSLRKTVILFDDPIDSYDESYFPEIAVMISDIISTNYSIIFTHSLIAIETFSYVKVKTYSYYFFHKVGYTPELVSISHKEVKALNQFGGDYGLVDYWLKQKDLKPKTEMLVLGAVPILRNSIEFIHKYLEKSNNESDKTNTRKISSEMKKIYQSLCNNVSHYRVTGLKNISYVENDYNLIFESVISKKRKTMFNAIGRFSLIDFIIKDILSNETLYISNRRFSDIILYRFIVMLFVKRTVEYNLINIARNLSLSISSLTSGHTLSKQFDYIDKNIASTDIDYNLFIQLVSYKNKYLNFINSMSHSSNRMIPPFLMMEDKKVNRIITDLKSLRNINLIC